MLKEFKAFIQRGNVLDLAVAVVMGAAFGGVVKSLVDDMLMPLLSKLTGKADFTYLHLDLGGGTLLKYGNFIQSVIAFLIVAYAIFLIIKAINKLNALAAGKKKEEEAKPKEPTDDIKLLTEIRDLLKK